MKYIIKNIQLDINVAEYESDFLIKPESIDSAYSGENYCTIDENGVIFLSDSPVIERIWSKFEFLKRFTLQERLTIRQMAKDNILLEDFLSLIQVVDNVSTKNEDLLNALTLFEELGIISAERKNEILNGE